LNPGKLILVTGGARSGKSTFAEQYASESGKEVIYLATAEVKDEEMQARVEQHRLQRPQHFRVIEEPLHPECHLKEGHSENFFLLDCLTILLSNHLLKGMEKVETEENLSWQEKEAFCTSVMNYVDQLLREVQNCSSDVLVVTNEVGWGIVPEHFWGRIFRDLAGKANRSVATQADEVWLTVCGITKKIKP